MRQLGLPALSAIVFGSSVAQREREKKHNDDPDFEWNAEDDSLSEDNDSDDSLIPETEDLQNMKSGRGCFKHMVLEFLSIQ